METSTISIDSLINAKDVKEQHPASVVVKFKVKYPEDYQGQKIMLDGSVQEVAPDMGKYFEELGIGSIVEDEPGEDEDAAKAKALADEDESAAIAKAPADEEAVKKAANKPRR